MIECLNLLTFMIICQLLPAYFVLWRKQRQKLAITDESLESNGSIVENKLY